MLPSSSANVQNSLTEASIRSTVLLVEHFLLLHDSRVVDQLDGLIFLDMKGRHDLCLDRRICRNPNRTAEEIDHLTRYYQQHVWRSYQRYCEPLVNEYRKQHPESAICIDGTLESDQVLQQASISIQNWLSERRARR